MDSSETEILIPEQVLTNEPEQVRVVLALFFSSGKGIMVKTLGETYNIYLWFLKLFLPSSPIGGVW